MNKNLRSPDTKEPSSLFTDILRAFGGAGRALAGILLIILGMVVMVVGMAPIKLHGLGRDILGEDATTAGLLALTVAGWLTVGLGLLVMGAGVLLLGKRGKALSVRFGCLLFLGGIATYLGDLILNQGPKGPEAVFEVNVARTLGLVAALLGILLMSLALGWLTEGRGGIFDD
jgi:hypothetical protein